MNNETTAKQADGCGIGDSNQSIDFDEFRELAILSAANLQITKCTLIQILRLSRLTFENYL